MQNSAFEFLLFQSSEAADGVQVLYKDETIWASQKTMAALFGCTPDNISLHLRNVFRDGELDKTAVAEKISATASDDKSYLDAIISEGYRINSSRATRIDVIFEAGGDYVLPEAGKVTAEYAKSFAEAEYKKYRELQDHIFRSDFDEFSKLMDNDGNALAELTSEP